MFKALLALSVLGAIAFWIWGGLDKNIDYQARVTTLQVQQTKEDVEQRSKEISAGHSIENQEYLRRKKAREEEIARAEKTLQEDRAVADEHVAITEKQASEFEAEANKKDKSVSPLEAYKRGK